MWDLIVSVPDHCLSFYFEPERLTEESRLFISLKTKSTPCKSSMQKKLTAMHQNLPQTI